MKFIGYFTIDTITESSPLELWLKFKNVGQINKQDFFEYYKGKTSGYSIGIKEFVKFKKGINPKEVFSNFYPPQSYQYINQQETSKIFSKTFNRPPKEKIMDLLSCTTA